MYSKSEEQRQDVAAVQANKENTTTNHLSQKFRGPTQDSLLYTATLAGHTTFFQEFFVQLRTPCRHGCVLPKEAVKRQAESRALTWLFLRKVIKGA